MTITAARSTQVTGAAVGFVAVVCVVVRLLVAGDGLDRVWAEDGAVFLADARASGLGSVVTEYSGYAHLVPRLLAYVGSLLPLGSFAAFAVLAAAAVVGLLAWYVFSVAKRMTSSVVWAVVAALALALVPAYRVEALGNLANLQWFLSPAAAWAVVDADRDRPVVAVVVVLAAATSSPLVVLLLPALFIVRGLAGWREPVAVALVGGLAFQGVVWLAGMHSLANPAPRSPGVSAGMAVDVFEQVGAISQASALAGIVLVAVTVVAWFVGARGNRVAVALVVTSALFVAVPTVLNGSAQPRYVACGFVLLVWAACLAAPVLNRALAGGMAVVLLAGAALGFAADPYRVSGPSWRAQVDTPCTGQILDVHLSPEAWGSIRLRCEPEPVRRINVP